MRKVKLGVLMGLLILGGGVVAWNIQAIKRPDVATMDPVSDAMPASPTLVDPSPLPSVPEPQLQPLAPASPSPNRLSQDGGHALESPWQAAEVDAAFPLAEPGEGVEQPQPIALQGSGLGRAQVGDSVTLPLPDGSTLVARVTKVQLQRGGERNWQGEVRIDGDSYPVNFTVGKQATFGFIGTPQGSYSVETLGGKGWVYKNPPLDRGHGGTDGLIPTHP